MRIGLAARHPKPELEVNRANILRTRLLLDRQFVFENLLQQQLSYFSIDLPNLRIERRHRALMLVEHRVGDGAKLIPQRGHVAFREPLVTMTLEESPQRFVKKTPCIKRGKIKRRFTARLEFQYFFGKEFERASSKKAQLACAEGMSFAVVFAESGDQVHIADHPVKGSQPAPVSFALDRNTPPGSIAEH